MTKFVNNNRLLINFKKLSKMIYLTSAKLLNIYDFILFHSYFKNFILRCLQWTTH